ncbi:hypothetical protein DFP72DRAFT_1139758 [Ephemerocybe angulata]|uniref:Uncharacterized protein n=1 Tax=Ephemerocybe angulata TaxID=980116 RepID=A0A8H6HQN7_9AGAR|nr:hypothetical protein DFP72DRAFT_1139758 [Tulosesus angulatus]
MCSALGTGSDSDSQSSGRDHGKRCNACIMIHRDSTADFGVPRTERCHEIGAKTNARHISIANATMSWRYWVRRATPRPVSEGNPDRLVSNITFDYVVSIGTQVISLKNQNQTKRPKTQNLALCSPMPAVHISLPHNDISIHRCRGYYYLRTRSASADTARPNEELVRRKCTGHIWVSGTNTRKKLPHQLSAPLPLPHATSPHTMQDQSIHTDPTQSPQHSNGTRHTIPLPQVVQHIIVVPRSTSYYIHHAGNVSFGANYGAFYQEEVNDLTRRRDQDALGVTATSEDRRKERRGPGIRVMLRSIFHRLKQVSTTTTTPRMPHFIRVALNQCRENTYSYISEGVEREITLMRDDRQMSPMILITSSAALIQSLQRLHNAVLTYPAFSSSGFYDASHQPESTFRLSSSLQHHNPRMNHTVTYLHDAEDNALSGFAPSGTPVPRLLDILLIHVSLQAIGDHIPGRPTINPSIPQPQDLEHKAGNVNLGSNYGWNSHLLYQEEVDNPPRQRDGDDRETVYFALDRSSDSESYLGESCRNAQHCRATASLHSPVGPSRAEGSEGRKREGMWVVIGRCFQRSAARVV